MVGIASFFACFGRNAPLTTAQPDGNDMATTSHQTASPPDRRSAAQDMCETTPRKSACILCHINCGIDVRQDKVGLSCW